MDFESLVSRLQRVKRCGKGISAKCPGHEDANNSLSASPANDRILLKCFTGCTTDHIVEAMGLTLADLYYEHRNGKAQSSSNGSRLTLAEFAQAKGLAAGYLREQGVEERDSRLIFHYLLMNGQRAARQRIRTALAGEQRFLWNKADGRPVPYGLWHLPFWRKNNAEDLFLVEGESDALTLWTPGFPALGIPGADQAGLLQEPHVRGFRRIFVLREKDRRKPDAPPTSLLGCETFEQGCIARLAGLEYRGNVAVIEMARCEPALKDINDLYLRYRDQPEQFVTAFEALRDTARPVELPIVGLEIFDASAVAERPVEWIWPPRIPLGMLTLFAGPPAKGKSFAALDIAAHGSTSRRWPDGSPNNNIFDSLIFSAEDSIERTIVPRLRALDADLSHIKLVRRLLEANEAGDITRRAFNLARDLPHLEHALNQYPQTRYVVIDPVSAYMGRTDSHKNAEVRSDVLDPLAELAERRNVGIVAVTHFNKTTSSNSLERVSGSIAFPAAARMVWGFAKDPDDPGRKLMLLGKTNVGPELAGLAFRIIGLDDGRATIQWVKGEVEHKLDDVLREEQQNQRESNRDNHKLDAAKALIRDLCTGRRLLVSELERCASERGISERTLNTARSGMKVQWQREGFGRDSRIYVWLEEGEQ